MKILMLAQFYPPIIGGEERHVHTLSVALAARGHDVSVATLWQEGQPTLAYEQGVRIHRIRSSMQRIPLLFSEKARRYAPPFPDPEFMRELRRIIVEEQPEIVHAHNWIVHSFTLLKSWSKARLIMTLHDCSHVCVQKRFMHSGQTLCQGPSLKKCLLCATTFYGAAKGIPTTMANWFWGSIERRAVDMFLPVSQAMVEVNQLKQYGVPFHILPNFVLDGVERQHDRTDDFVKKLPDEDFMLFVGDVTHDKGIDVLLPAYEALNTHVPLVIIGRTVADTPVSFPRNTFYLESWPHPAIMQAWKRCIFGLVPSTCLESFGIVAIEAMLMGRPVIASRIGGLRDVVSDNETGFLVPPGDRSALQRAIQHLLENPELRKQMGDQAQQKVVAFKSETVIPQIEQVYQKVLSR